MSDREQKVVDLKDNRPRDWFVRVSLGVFLSLLVGAWFAGDVIHGLGLDPNGYVTAFEFTDLFSSRRMERLDRFIQNDVALRPLPGSDESPGLVQFGWHFFVTDSPDRDSGFSAAIMTLAIAVGSIVLAGMGAVVFSLPASRNIATSEPFLPSGRQPQQGHRWFWKGVVVVTRLVLIFFRAIPEYVWAFLFLAIFGPKAWPAVLALAIHNMGILGKLNAETIENVERAAPSALRGLGATRGHIVLTSIYPAVLPRFLLYFFYRWETCVREATVLGMLGFASLGVLIQDARVRFRYDLMLLFIGFGVVLVLVGDLVSMIARGLVRRAS